MQYLLIAAVVLLFILTAVLFFIRKNAPPPYVRAALFTKREAAFLRELSRFAGRRGLVLYAKVRVADMLAVKPGTRNYQTWFNKISQKHADFVLADAAGLTVLAVVELDDATHDRPERIERDRFVDAAYKSAGIPVVHVRDERGRELEQMLLRAVK